jgi:hypothetical protein
LVGGAPVAAVALSEPLGRSFFGLFTGFHLRIRGLRLR